jgi:hypothetical protein
VTKEAIESSRRVADLCSGQGGHPGERSHWGRQGHRGGREAGHVHGSQSGGRGLGTGRALEEGGKEEQGSAAKS